MLISYPLLLLDQIGVELENPFSTTSASHLPLDEMCAHIELSVRAIAQCSSLAHDRQQELSEHLHEKAAC